MAIGLAVGLSACGTPETVVPSGSNPVESPEATVTQVAPEETADTGSALAMANLADAEGNPAGEVTFTQAGGSLQVSVSVEEMAPGFYGFHVHEIGECKADSASPDDPSDIGAFKSSGGHIPGESDAKHPDHAGDLPPLLVGEGGTATMTVTTDRLDESLLMDSDGSAVVIHSLPDNFANIPERYAPDGPDEDTTGAGDAGLRLACGVVEG
ncbi:MAG: superoxide dismutase family protein [Propionibacteriaceae bacterium]|nr:superoxide dismutase family protein [Propionibacteriaceae bacterium]